MSYVDQGMTKGRFYAIVGVAVLHALLGFAIVTGLAGNFVKNVTEDLKTFDVQDEPPPPEEEPPPPPDVPQTEPPPVTPPAAVRIQQPQAPVIQSIQTPVPRQITPIPQPAAPAPQPAPAPRVTPPQRARANLSSYFSTDDYPAAALRAEASGTTRFSLTIGPDGRVSGCNVTGSSGNSALDAATCRILRSRARYTPARDSSGNPTSGADRGSVAWRLPAE